MSGGHFDYKQYEIGQIADDIEVIIHSNNKSDYPYSPETILEFREAVLLLRKAAIYAQRIDWLVSGDDGEEGFHGRLEKELKKLEEA